MPEHPPDRNGQGSAMLRYFYDFSLFLRKILTNLLMMIDLFEKLKMEAGPLAKYSHLPDDYFFFPKLEGEIGPHMTFNGKNVLNWSLNNYRVLPTTLRSVKRILMLLQSSV